ncbi:tetratricopeptide repeat protein [Streptomyces massasporeus]
MNENRASEAVRRARNLVESEPDSAVNWAALGKAQFYSGAVEESIDSYRRVINIAPEISMGWFHLGISYAEVGRYKMGAASFLVAASLDPADSLAWGEMGNSFASLNRHVDAVSAFEHSLQGSRVLATYIHRLARSLDSLGRRNQAIRAFDEAVRLDPGNADAWSDRGSYLAREAEECLSDQELPVRHFGVIVLRSALYSWEMALEVDPTHSIAQTNRDSLLRKVGEEFRSISPLEENGQFYIHDFDTYPDDGHELEGESVMDRTVEIDWVVPEGKRMQVIREIEENEGTVQLSGDPYVPEVEDPLNVSDSSFEPLIIIVCVIAFPYFIRQLHRAWRDIREQGGQIIDTRNGRIRIRSVDSLDRGTVVLVTDDGSQVHRAENEESLTQLISALLGL